MIISDSNLKMLCRFFAIVASFSMFAWCTGCGKPGYISRAEDLCKSFRIANQQQDLLRWATNQLNEYTPDTSRPGMRQIMNVPDWLRDIDGSFRPGATLVLATNSQNDYVRVEWASRRGVWGLMLGGAPNCVPDLDQAHFYCHRCQPGVYTFHSTTDY
jgi:hypothetical protein